MTHSVLQELFNWILSLYNANKKHNNCRNKENVDKPTDSIDTNDTENPENQKSYCECYKHIFFVNL